MSYRLITSAKGVYNKGVYKGEYKGDYEGEY